MTWIEFYSFRYLVKLFLWGMLKCGIDLILDCGSSFSSDFNRGRGVVGILISFVALIRLLDSWIELSVCSFGLEFFDLLLFLSLCLSWGSWALPFSSYVRLCGIYVKLNPTSDSRFTCMTFLISYFHVHPRF